MTSDRAQEFIALARRQRIVPVLRFGDRSTAAFVVRALEPLFEVIELTYTIPDVLGLIAELKATGASRRALGVGTIVDRRMAEDALAAGADFVVSPGWVEGLVQAAAGHGVPSLVGAFTPTEVIRALGSGADVVKLFPAATGGPGHVAALRAVFPQAVFCPTGGIGVDDVAAYLRAGADFVGVGAQLLDADAVRSGDAARVTLRAREFLERACGDRSC